MRQALKALVFLAFFSPFSSMGQSNSELMEKAYEYAFDGHRDSARLVCDLVISREPDYISAYVLKGRTYAWDKMFEPGREIIKTALEKDPDNTEAQMVRFNLEYWSGNYKEGVRVSDEAISMHPNEPRFYVNKAKAHDKLEEKDEAGQALTRALEIDPSNEEALDLRLKLKTNVRNSKLRIGYGINMFHGSKPWHEYGAELSHRFRRVSAILRLNEARRFDRVDQLIEADFYPKIRSGTYGFISLGTGIKRTLYPQIRAAAELFQRLPRSFEASAGIRYLKFNSPDPTIIYTGSIGKYYKSYWFSLRVYLTPKEESFSRSFYFFVREYFSSANDFLGVTLGTGFSPDLANLDQADIDNLQNLRAYSIRLERRWTFWENFLAGVNVGYQNEEVRLNSFRSRYSIGANIQYLF